MESFQFVRGKLLEDCGVFVYSWRCTLVDASVFNFKKNDYSILINVNLWGKATNEYHENRPTINFCKRL